MWLTVIVVCFLSCFYMVTFPWVCILLVETCACVHLFTYRWSTYFFFLSERACKRESLIWNEGLLESGELNFNQANVLPVSRVQIELTLALCWGAWLGCSLPQGCHSSMLSPSRRGGAPRLWGKVWLEPGARASRRWLQGGGRQQEEEEETVPAG